MTSRWLAVLSIGVAVACGGSREPAPTLQSAPTPTPTAPPKPVEPAPVVTPVSFDRLMTFLPAVTGWTRGSARGENAGAGIDASKAEAQYQKDDGVIELEIIDSALNPMVLMPKTMFMGPGYSERTPEGYRKALTIGGFPGSEAWDGDAQRAEVVAVVAKRYVVQATGSNVDGPGPVRSLVNAVNLAGLAAIK